jgi:hypothetical protein
MISERSLQIAYTAFSVFLVCCAYFSLRAKRPALVVFFGFCFFYLALRGVMLLSDTYGIFGLLHGGREFEAVMLVKVLWITLAFVGAVLLGYGKFTVNKPENSDHGQTPDSVLQIAFFVVWIGSIITMLLASVSRVFNWIFCFIILGGVYYLFYRPKFYPRLLTFSVGISAIVFALGRTIERRDWAIAAASVSLIFILSQSRKIFRLAILSTVMVAVIAFVAIMLRTGDRLSVNDTIERLSTAKAALPFVEYDLDFPIVFDDLTIMMTEVPRRIDFTYGKHFFKPVFSWIPRDVWPTKPDSLSRYYSEVLNQPFYRDGGSEPPTFVGELYWNFSLFGLVIALGLGKLIRHIDDYSLRARDRLQYVNSIILATMVFYLLRGPIDTFWLAYAFYFSAWFMVSTLVELFNSTSRAVPERPKKYEKPPLAC